MFDTERRRAKKFVEGLVLALRSRVLGFRCPTLADAVELAARYEDDRKLFLEEHPKGKGKSSSQQPSVSGGLSSGSSGSSRKKRKEHSDFVAEEGRSSFGRGSSRYSQTGSSGGPKTCFKCGKPGHMALYYNSKP